MDENAMKQGPFDLQQIHGIGPGVARRLQQAGIADVAALAIADPEQIAAALRDMPVVSNERIHEWIEAAGRLASAASPAEADNGQHYATFRLELLLDPRNDVRRTRVSHVQSGAEESWAGWAVERMGRFVAGSAGLRPPSTTPTATEAGVEAQTSAGAETAELRLHDLHIVDPQTSASRRIVYRGRLYDVRFGVAIDEQGRWPQEPARINAAVYARSLSGEQRHHLARQAMMQSLSPEMAVSVGVIPAPALSPGPYRLEVELDMETADRRRRWPTASLHEGMLIVF